MNSKKKHTNKTLVLILVLASLAAVVIMFAAVAVLKDTSGKPSGSDKQTLNGYAVPDYVDVQLIDIDGHARRGVKLEGGVKDIVIHYVNRSKQQGLLQSGNYNGQLSFCNWT